MAASKLALYLYLNPCPTILKRTFRGSTVNFSYCSLNSLSSFERREQSSLCLNKGKVRRSSKRGFSSDAQPVTLLPRPRRAFLYVPGDNENMIAKASGLNVDSICLDMEDGVAESSKDKARETITRALDSVKFQNKVDVCVRINSIESKRAEKDLEAVFTAENAPKSICLPKVEKPVEVDWLLNKIYGLAMGRPSSYKVHILLVCETPLAILNLDKICTEMSELSTVLNCNLVPDSIIFGSDDYCAAIGATRSESAIEVLYARQKLVMVSKMFNLQAIDMVYNNLTNEEGFITNCMQGKGMGFNGKQIINPKQIEVAQKCFSPSEEEITWASELIAEWEAKAQEGVGAILFKGRMIDMPLVNQARNILRVKEKMGL